MYIDFKRFIRLSVRPRLRPTFQIISLSTLSNAALKPMNIRFVSFIKCLLCSKAWRIEKTWIRQLRLGLKQPGFSLLTSRMHAGSSQFLSITSRLSKAFTTEMFLCSCHKPHYRLFCLLVLFQLFSTLGEFQPVPRLCP